MIVKRNPGVNFSIQGLAPAEHEKVLAWMERLSHWDTDAGVREASKPSPVKDVLYVAVPEGFRIFFNIDGGKNEITILDVMNSAWFVYDTQSKG